YAQPGVVLDAELGGAFRLVLGQVAEVVAEALDGAAVEAGPVGGLAQGHAAALGHALVGVGDAGDHVNVRVDVVQGGLLCDPVTPDRGSLAVLILPQGAGPFAEECSGEACAAGALADLVAGHGEQAEVLDHDDQRQDDDYPNQAEGTCSGNKECV